MKCRHGKLRRTVSAFTNLKTMSRAMCNMDGSTKHHELSTSIRERNLTIKLVRLSRLCCAGMALSSVHLLRRLRLPVDVAVLWIPLATAQRVPEQGCWADGVRGRECSRQCLPKSWRSRDREHDGETWIWGLSCHMLTTAVDWKVSRPTASRHSLAGCIWRWSPRSSPLHCNSPARPGAAQMCPEAHGEATYKLGWSDLPPDFWPVRRRGWSPASSEARWHKGGGCGPRMQRCWGVRCFSFEPQALGMVLTEMFLSRTKCE